ncbi:MAG: hypothetical protein WAM26_15700, partial [Nitrososphaeraceae archaeon]
AGQPFTSIMPCPSNAIAGHTLPCTNPSSSSVLALSSIPSLPHSVSISFSTSKGVPPLMSPLSLSSPPSPSPSILMACTKSSPRLIVQ